MPNNYSGLGHTIYKCKFCPYRGKLGMSLQHLIKWHKFDAAYVNNDFMYCTKRFLIVDGYVKSKD